MKDHQLAQLMIAELLLSKPQVTSNGEENSIFNQIIIIHHYHINLFNNNHQFIQNLLYQMNNKFLLQGFHQTQNNAKQSQISSQDVSTSSINGELQDPENKRRLTSDEDMKNKGSHKKEERSLRRS